MYNTDAHSTTVCELLNSAFCSTVHVTQMFSILCYIHPSALFSIEQIHYNLNYQIFLM